MANKGYKKYMKNDVRKGHPLIQIFAVSFFGMFLLFTFVINSYSKRLTVDTSIGDYKESSEELLEQKKIVDDRLQMIQNEDQGRTFSDLMSKPQDVQPAEDPLKNDVIYESKITEKKQPETKDDIPLPVVQDPVYKVFVGSYTSAEQARVAKEIIQESGNGLNPIVKCIGSNDYTLQVGIFKNKQSAETMLNTIQQNHLPGRIVQDN